MGYIFGEAAGFPGTGEGRNLLFPVKSVKKITF